MPRVSAYLLLPFFAILAASFSCAVPAAAGPHLLPRIHMPKINLGKGLNALTYPVKKSVVNGGKTILNTGITIGTGQEIEKLVPASPGGIAKKIIVWGVGRH